MEKRIQDAFDQVTMPDACVKKIEARLGSPAPASGPRYTAEPTPVHTRQGWMTGIAAAAVCLALMLAALGTLPQENTPQLTEVPTTAVTEATDAAEETLPVYDEATLQAIQALEQGFVYTEGKTIYSIGPNAENVDTKYTDPKGHSPFTEYIDGRVYFVSNGENLDITDLFSEDEPYTYIYTDSRLLTHYIAIGGTPEHIGYLEMVQASWDSSPGGFICGGSTNTWNSEAEARYGWETKAKEIFEPYGVYWVS